MTKLYFPLFVLFLSIVCLPESQAQRRTRKAEKDTIVYVYCSSFPPGLNALATYQAAQQHLTKEESDRFTLETIELTDKDFSPDMLQKTVEMLGKRGKNTRVIFHFFDHGQNTGGILPALESPYAPSVNGKPGLIDVGKSVIEPLNTSKLGFLLVLVDACNLAIAQQPGSQPRQPKTTEDLNKPLSMEAVLKKLQASNKEGRETIKKTGVERGLRNEHLGLLLSSKGWLAISTASPDQEAVAPRGFGGTGSLLFFNILANNDDVNKNWVKFLDEYRRALESADRNRVQTPIWEGKVNDQPMAEEELLNPLRIVSDEAEIQAMLEQQNSKISIDTLKAVGRETVREFCNQLNALDEYDRLPKSLRDICIKPTNQVLIYDDLSVPMNRDLNTKHVTLEQYRSKIGIFESTYNLDSLKLDRIYEDTRRTGVLYVVYFAGKNITKSGKLDTLVRQRIYLEVQPEADPSFWQKTFGWLIRKKNRETENAPLLVNQVRNVPGTWGKKVVIPPGPGPKDDTTKTIVKKPEPPTPEDYFKDNGFKLIQSLYGLIEQAANNNKQSVSKDTLLQKARALFFHPESDTFQVSILQKPTKILSPDAYFKRFWTEFEGLYDSVHYSFKNPETLTNGKNATGYLIPRGKDKWQARIQFEQRFEGFKNKKRTYGDVTVKQATIWITRTPNDAEPFYELRVGPVQVISTKPLPKK